MALHLILLAMLVAAILAVLVPLARAGRGLGVAHDGAATLGPVALHRMRLVEIDRDLDRGLLDASGAEAARNEAARILLRAADRDEAVKSPTNGDRAPALRRRRVAALAAVVMLPALALGLYALLGSPDQPSMPFASRASLDPDQTDVNALIGQIEAHLAAQPNDGKGYEIIAPIYMRLGRYDDAVRARSEALRLLGETPDRLADLAEARVAVADGVITSEAAQEIARALALDRKHPKARFLQAIGYEQDGRRDEAAAALKALLADSPAAAPWRPVVEARLARLAAPGGAKAAVFRPEAANNPAIRAMVEGLATQLNEKGGSAEEWARLVRSYAVLGEADKARAALAAARAAHPDAASLATFAEVARAAGIEGAP